MTHWPVIKNLLATVAMNPLEKRSGNSRVSNTQIKE